MNFIYIIAGLDFLSPGLEGGKLIYLLLAAIVACMVHHLVCIIN